jgi:primase-polymerase (primpol)-like protein
MPDIRLPAFTPWCFVPAAIKAHVRWLCWLCDRGSKVPASARFHGRASVMDEREWVDLRTARQAVSRMGYAGLGYVLGNGVVGVDLDDCRDPISGTLTPAARSVVDRIASYTEVSPSGEGVKIFLQAEQQVSRKTRWIEVYSERRFFAVTGQHVVGTPEDLQSRDAELRWLCDDLFGSTPAVGAPTIGPHVAPGRTSNIEDDDELLKRASWAPNGEKFDALFGGRWHGRYPSQSEADLALCRMLANWTDRDAARIDRLFRRSGLMRPKWDSSRRTTTYGRMTIALAVK